MASVIGHNEEEIKLRDCSCGGEPEYRSASGLVHVVTCPKCGAMTKWERCAYDAVSKWNLSQ